MKKLISFALILCVLAVAPSQALAQACARQHTVKAGENLFRIGLIYGVAWPSIASANKLTNPNRIFVGQVLCIPAAATPATPARTPTPAARTPTRVPATSTPAPRPGTVPTIRIVSVVRDQTVTLQATNFPANRKFDVLMGRMGTRGVNGTLVATTDSGNGAFSATYNIPAGLKGLRQIAIRLQSQSSGHFSFNWFYNNTTP